jgi:hypothetical protein
MFNFFFGDGFLAEKGMMLEIHPNETSGGLLRTQNFKINSLQTSNLTGNRISVCSLNFAQFSVNRLMTIFRSFISELA